MDDQQYLATFEELLGHLVLGGADTSRIQAASNALNTQYYDQARCVPALVELMNRSEHWQVSGWCGTCILQCNVAADGSYRVHVQWVAMTNCTLMSSLLPRS